MHNDLNYTELNNRLRLISQYTRWLDDLVNHGRDDDLYYGSLVTLMFDHVSGDFSRRRSIMLDEADRVYNTLIRHCVRNTRSPSQRKKLPIALFALDNKLGSFKRPRSIRLHNANDGLHVHGVVLVHVNCRLRRHLADHIGAHENHYVRDDRPLSRIHLRPIRSAADETTDYALKSLKGKLPDIDNLIVLPKARSELS